MSPSAAAQPKSRNVTVQQLEDVLDEVVRQKQTHSPATGVKGPLRHGSTQETGLRSVTGTHRSCLSTVARPEEG